MTVRHLNPSSEGLAILNLSFGTLGAAAPGQGHCCPQPLTEAAASAACSAWSRGVGVSAAAFAICWWSGAGPAATWTVPLAGPSCARWLLSGKWMCPRDGGVPGSPGPPALPWGSEQPHGAEEVLPVWWLFSSSTPGVARGGWTSWDEGKLFFQSPPPAPGVLCDLKPKFLKAKAH